MLIYRLLDYVKQKTEHKLIFKVRALFLHFLLYIINFDTYLIFLINRFFFKRKLDKKNIAFISLYRPLFWHGNIFETHFYKMLQKKGQRPVNIVCRGFLDVCDVHYFKSNKQNNPLVCSNCRLRNDLFYFKNKQDTLFIDNYFKPDAATEQALAEVAAIATLAAAKNYHYAGLPLGKLVHLSVCRYWLRLNLDETHLPTYKSFLTSAIKLHNACSNLLAAESFENSMVFNGRYATFNIPLQLLTQNDINYSTYEFSEQERIFYSQNKISVLWDDVKEKFTQWRTAQSVTPALMQEVQDFWLRRKKLFVSSYVDVNTAIKIPRVDVAVFTNVIWDSAAFGRETIFASQFAWINDLIEWAIAHPSKKMVIRIHPAEVNVVYNKSDEKMAAYIEQHFPQLPPNIQVIPAAVRENSYHLLENAKVSCVYSSSMGLEGALANKCVITAAWTHYMFLGVTLNPTSRADFFTLLEQNLAAEKPFQPNHDLVLLYIYWFYKVHHRLHDTHLYKKPFLLPEDSLFMRIPKVDPNISSPELNAMLTEFLE